ncbi:MAG: hypothetical protein NTW87_05275 [Planctomycetota bacterium]|nr:hypothetical protein [Planctomycetota bacterium]
MRGRMLISLGLACAAAGILRAENDKPDESLTLIVRHDGTAVSVATITRDDYLLVAGVGKGGGKVSVPSHTVKEVLYANRDENYSTALEKRDEERFSLAALYFKKALEKMPTEKWAVEYCNYGLGNALYAKGAFTGIARDGVPIAASPATCFGKVLEANPRSRFLPEIAVKLPVCLAEEGKLDAAEAALRSSEAQIRQYRADLLKDNVAGLRLADRARAELAITAARIAERRAEAGTGDRQPIPKQPGIGVSPPGAAAVEQWRTARARCASFPELWAESATGVLRALIGNREWDAALSEAAGILERLKNEPSAKNAALAAAAHVSAGKAHLAQAEAFAQKQQKLQASMAYAEARWAFLNALGTCSGDEELTATAHYFAGVCYDKLRGVESDAGQKAGREWALVVERFPRSSVREMAARELARARAE